MNEYWIFKPRGLRSGQTNQGLNSAKACEIQQHYLVEIRQQRSTFTVVAS